MNLWSISAEYPRKQHFQLVKSLPKFLSSVIPLYPLYIIQIFSRRERGIFDFTRSLLFNTIWSFFRTNFEDNSG